ncbi:glycoside hydrolase family 32 protein [Clostridium perfringens]|uniref:glycoside hydrolase family 32 protein n=1 Tax=Clostridium perfringens TaxID=1502 RepID=UPI0037481640
MEWTRKQRYRKIEDISKDAYEVLEKKVYNCKYRQKFHIQPKTGLLNDPNGFSFYNGEYHLFYQWFPLGPVHGLKYWYHVSSKDLVNWEDKGIGIKPTKYFESHGAFSGSGIVNNDELYLFYTGNTRDENWIRHPYQCLAIMNKQGEIRKLDNPIICKPEGYKEHFRDPKVLKYNGKYYCLIGAQDKNNLGTIVYYESEDLLNWKFKKELYTRFKGNGFMWECPDYFELKDKGILILSVQGLEANRDRFKNGDNSGYLVGNKINFEDGIFNHGDFEELDRGFDFYAPQTMEDENGRRILIGWCGLPGVDCVTEESGWAHNMTLPRVITIKNNKLYQAPLKELEILRKNERSINTTLNNEEKEFEGFNGDTYELICNFKNITGRYVGLKFRKGIGQETIFYYDLKEKKVVLNREKSGQPTVLEFGTVRRCNMNGKELKFQMFVDISMVEIFINHGQEVFTARIYPDKESTGISFFSDKSSELEAKIWDLKSEK